MMAVRYPHTPMTTGNKVVSAVDWLGNRFKLGDQVIYAIGLSGRATMCIGEVLQIKVQTAYRNLNQPVADDSDDFDIYIPTTRKKFRTVKEPYDDITVQVLTKKTSGRLDSAARERPAWVNPATVTLWLAAQETA